MEAWLGRALECCRRSGGEGSSGVVRPLALRTALPAALNLLIWNWETSNKKGASLYVGVFISRFRALTITILHVCVLAVATVVPQAFDRLVQLLRALEEGGAGDSAGLSVSGLAGLLGQQAPTRYVKVR